jgi:hypothetical protein
MGIYYTATAGIGFMFDLVSFKTEEVQVESCNHKERLDQKFCPMCGEKVGSYTDVRSSRKMREIEEFLFETSFPDNFVHENLYETTKHFIGFGVKVFQNDEPKIIKEILSHDEIKKICRELLAPFGVELADKDFGLYGLCVGA